MPLNPMDPSLFNSRGADMYNELLKNSGDQSILDRVTTSQIESLLDEPLRDRLRQAMKRADPSRRH